jgi:hypothetical protein
LIALWLPIKRSLAVAVENAWNAFTIQIDQLVLRGQAQAGQRPTVFFHQGLEYVVFRLESGICELQLWEGARLVTALLIPIADRFDRAQQGDDGRFVIVKAGRVDERRIRT